MFDPLIQRRKTTVMQRIQQAASRGYSLYISGTIPAVKAQPLADKFAQKYKIDANENQRSYRRRLQKSNTFLFMYPKKDSTDILWWLMATEGTGAIHDEERLIKIFDKHNRLTWENDYELVVLPKENSKHTVTWRMTRRCYQDWNTRIRKSIRQKYTDDKVRQSIWSLARTPGFSGIRNQVKSLYKLLAAEWNRTRKKSSVMPPLPRVNYVRGIKSETAPLSLVTRRLGLGKKPFPRIDSKTEKIE